MATRSHEIFSSSKLANNEQLLELLYRVSTLSSPHLNRSFHYQIDTSHICSISKNKLYERSETISLNVADDVLAYYNYILQSNIEAISQIFNDSNNARTFLLQEENNKDTKFCSRITSVVEGNVSMMLSKMNFVKSSEKEVSLVLRIETAEKVTLNIMKVFNDNGSYHYKIELAYAVDGINSQQSQEKLKMLANWIKVD